MTFCLVGTAVHRPHWIENTFLFSGHCISPPSLNWECLSIQWAPQFTALTKLKITFGLVGTTVHCSHWIENAFWFSGHHNSTLSLNWKWLSVQWTPQFHAFTKLGKPFCSVGTAFHRFHWTRKYSSAFSVTVYSSWFYIFAKSQFPSTRQ